MKFLLFLSDNDWWGLTKKQEFIQDLVKRIYNALWPILIIVAVVGCIWAVWLGVKMAKADESSKRDEARKNVINTVAAMGIVILLIVSIQTIIIPNIPDWIGVDYTVTDAELGTATTAGTTKSDVESMFGQPYSVDGNTSVYHVKVGEILKIVTITYSEDKVSSAAQANKGDAS